MSDYGTKEARLIEANGGWRKRADRDAYSIIQLTERLREVEEERDQCRAKLIAAELRMRELEFVVVALTDGAKAALTELDVTIEGTRVE